MRILSPAEQIAGGYLASDVLSRVRDQATLSVQDSPSAEVESEQEGFASGESLLLAEI